MPFVLFLQGLLILKLLGRRKRMNRSFKGRKWTFFQVEYPWINGTPIQRGWGWTLLQVARLIKGRIKGREWTLLQVAYPWIYRTNLQYPAKNNLQPNSPLLPRISMLPQTLALMNRIFFQRLFPIPGLVTVCLNFKYSICENFKVFFQF